VKRLTEADNGTWESDSENLPSVSGAEAILKDRQGRVWWIAGWEGVHYSEGNGWRRVTAASGLPDNHVNCIYEDRDGHIWFGTDGGVVHYDGHIFQTIRSPHIKSTNAIIQDRRNRFWFGTINGVIRYTIDPTPPDVRILHVVADRIYNLSRSIFMYRIHRSHSNTPVSDSLQNPGTCSIFIGWRALTMTGISRPGRGRPDIPNSRRRGIQLW